MQKEQNLDARIDELTEDLCAMHTETVTECVEYIAYGFPSYPRQRKYKADFPDLEKRERAKSELIKIIDTNPKYAKKAKKALQTESSPALTANDALLMIAGVIIAGASVVGVSNVYKFVAQYL